MPTLTSVIPSVTQWLQDSQLVPVIVLMVALLLLMSSMRRRQQAIKRRESGVAAPPAKPRAEANGSSQALRRDLDALLVELQDLSRRISAEIDTRFLKLESAMRDADRRIAVLNRLTRQLGAVGRADASMPVSTGSDPPNGAAVDTDLRHTVIYELADAGFSPLEIARELGRTPGEVELILNLRRQSQTKP